MAIIKCKMCGGDLMLAEDSSIATCEYCGSVQTIPKADDEKKLTLFARANRLRIGCEFDKAAGIYEAIVADFPEEAEAYWGLVLCKFGIEYVDDPATGKKIPTCHRSSFDSIMDDSDFEQAMENADSAARKVYREEAKAIEEIRKGIIAVSSNEEPYDIFICYKETAEDGQRTLDSVLAQDVYDALTEKGYRVFFSRITLEDKLGVEYEPYIFAALNSAKVMLTFGTDYEYFNAVWVKNEWSRFLKLMASDKEKHLIPCYKGIDAYDMPKEFAKLQAQDLGKVGATQDLLRGIEKILPRQKETVVVTQQPAANTGALTMRGQFALEDGDWKKADEYFERALDENPQDGGAYLGKVLAALQLSSAAQIDDYFIKIHDDKDYDRAIRFSDAATAKQLSDIRDRAHKKYLVKCLAVAAKKRARQIALEEARIARERQEEEERIAREKREEEERIAREKREEEARIAQEKREEERIAREKREKEEQIALEKRKEQLLPIRNKLRNAQGLLATTSYHTVGLKADGTVVAVGKNNKGQCNVHCWRNIIQIAASNFCTFGLKADGTVVAAGWSSVLGFNVTGWRDIVQIATSDHHTVGLKTDGTVVAVGRDVYGQCDADRWRDIIQVAEGGYHTVGLHADGTVVAIGDKKDGQRNVNDWRDIVQIAAGSNHTVGLKADGTVVAVGDNKFGPCNVTSWRDIVQIATSDLDTVGLRADGTVVTTSEYSDVTGWRDIIQVATSGSHTVGLKADGTVVVVGSDVHGQCDVDRWRLFLNYDNLDQERRRAAGLCQHCGRQLKGLFSKKCVSCGKPKDY